MQGGRGGTASGDQSQADTAEARAGAGDCRWGLRCKHRSPRVKRWRCCDANATASVVATTAATTSVVAQIPLFKA